MQQQQQQAMAPQYYTEYNQMTASPSGTGTPTMAPPHTPQTSTPQSHQMQQQQAAAATQQSTSTTQFRAKRQRNLTEEETASLTRNFQRGNFYVGASAPVKIDQRLTVRLVLGDEGDHVHFIVGETFV